MRILSLITIVMLLFSPVPGALSDSFSEVDKSSPVFKAAKVGVFPSAGLFDFPVASGGAVRQVAHSAGVISGDALSVDCFPSYGVSRGPGTILCRTPLRKGRTATSTQLATGGGVSSSFTELGPAAPAASSGGSAGVVRFEDLVTTVLDHASAPQAELVIQPDQGWVFTRIPTVGYFTVGQTTHEGVFGGVFATVRWFPTGFDVVFEPGARPVHADRKGASWPDHAVEYTYMSEGWFTPEATVSWGVEVTIGGRSVSYPHARQTHIAYPTAIEARIGQAHLIPNPWETIH